MMKISVIVPVYNSAKYLDKCIQSILRQNFTDFELLLINDGSLDNSGQICDLYTEKDQRIKTFHKENGGVSSARNLGLENCDGDWVAFVDSDDWVDKNYLQLLYEATKTDNIDLVIHGFTRESNGKNQLVDVGEGLILNRNTREMFEKHNLNMFGFPVSKLYKSEIISFNKLKFLNNLQLGEDQLFLLSYLGCCENIRLEKVHEYKYQIRDNSLSQSIDIEQYKLRYFCIKENMINNFPEFTRDLLSEKSFKKTIESLWIRLFGILRLNYLNCLHQKERIKFFKKLDEFDLKIMTASKNNLNPLFRFAIYLIENKSYFWADQIILFIFNKKNKKK